jgi:DNA-binding NarL/FixJ family response regulator
VGVCIVWDGAWSAGSGQRASKEASVVNVLVADDHALVRTGLIDILSRLEPELRVYEAANATEVMERLGTVSDLDLILLDLFMPGANGFDLLSRVCSVAGPVPVVVLSASDSAAHVQKSLDCGASGYLSKASARELLISALRLVLAGGVYIPAELTMHADQSAPIRATQAPGMHRTQPGAAFAGLTLRQQQVLRLLGRGWSNKQIARELGVSDNTVKVHVAGLLRQLGADNRTEAVMLAQQQGFDFDSA